MLSRGLEARSHAQVRSEFHKHLVRPGLLSRDDGRLYGRLFDLRQLGDYVPGRSLSAEDLGPLLEGAPGLLGRLRRLI